MAHFHEPDLQNFRYEATDRKGRRIRGVIAAPSRDRVVGVLLRMGFSVQTVHLARESRLRRWISSLPILGKFSSNVVQTLKD